MECKLKQIASVCKLNTIYISTKVNLKKGIRAYVLVIRAFFILRWYQANVLRKIIMKKLCDFGIMKRQSKIFF